MIAYDQTFKESTIYLDGNAFYRCRFERCTVVINGYLGCTLVDPQFVDCRWAVSGPAQNTIQLMSALYKAARRATKLRLRLGPTIYFSSRESGSLKR